MTHLCLLLANRCSSSGGSARHRCGYRRQSRRGKASAFRAVFSPRCAARVAGNDANDDGRDGFSKNETKKKTKTEKKKKSEKKKNIDETKLFIAGGG